jgi:hypothetical protein
VYNPPPWENFTKASYMGTNWQLTLVPQPILDQQDLTSAALRSLLSSTGMFKGDFDEFSHPISNIKGNGYLALCQILRMAHPVLGKTTAQPPHSKNQPFSKHAENYLDYFQSEACSGQVYSLNERVILIISLRRSLSRDMVKGKYTHIWSPRMVSSHTLSSAIWK